MDIKTLAHLEPIHKRQPDWVVRRGNMFNNQTFIGSDGERRYANLVIKLLSLPLKIFFKYTQLDAIFSRLAAKIELKHIDFFFAGLPDGLNGFKVLHLSDFHFDTNPHLIGQLRKLLLGQSVDVICATGDFFEDINKATVSDLDDFLQITNNINAGFGLIAVLGNHDSPETVRLLEDRGVRVLINEKVILSYNDNLIEITGVDDPSYYFHETAIEALRHRENGDFRIALVHSPELAEYAEQSGYDLYLTGHTHGGQICLPLIGGIFNDLLTCRGYTRGKWQHGNLQGYTSFGIGTSLLKIRFNCQGDATIITMRRAVEQIGAV